MLKKRICKGTKVARSRRGRWAYTYTDFKTKKELKEAVAKGKKMGIYNPSGMFQEPNNGKVVIEGPHYPKPHRWYAEAEIKDGIIIKVK
jgi:hypothetical protein